MTSRTHHKEYGYSLTEAISLMPGGLERDAIGLWNIVPVGRYGFDLAGEELTAFVRSSVRRVLDAGAVPVRHEPGSMFEWTLQKYYGSDKDEIVEAVIREWLSLPDDPKVLCGEGVWFAKPRPHQPLYIDLK